MMDGQGEKPNIHEHSCCKVETESFASGFYFYYGKPLNIFRSIENSRMNPFLVIAQP